MRMICLEYFLFELSYSGTYGSKSGKVDNRPNHSDRINIRTLQVGPTLNELQSLTRESWIHGTEVRDSCNCILVFLPLAMSHSLWPICWISSWCPCPSDSLMMMKSPKRALKSEWHLHWSFVSVAWLSIIEVQQKRPIILCPLWHLQGTHGIVGIEGKAYLPFRGARYIYFASHRACWAHTCSRDCENRFGRK